MFDCLHSVGESCSNPTIITPDCRVWWNCVSSADLQFHSTASMRNGRPSCLRRSSVWCDYQLDFNEACAARGHGFRPWRIFCNSLSHKDCSSYHWWSTTQSFWLHVVWWSRRPCMFCHGVDFVCETESADHDVIVMAFRMQWICS